MYADLHQSESRETGIEVEARFAVEFPVLNDFHYLIKPHSPCGYASRSSVLSARGGRMASFFFDDHNLRIRSFGLSVGSLRFGLPAWFILHAYVLLPQQ